MHKTVQLHGADVTADDLPLIDEQICMDAAAVSGVAGIVLNGVGPAFDPLALIFGQVKALRLLDCIVFFINFIEFWRNDNLGYLDRILIEAPAEL